jgi:glycosyltransferase involved in cell wall biosynthesis
MKILHLIDSGGLYGAERVMLQLALESQRRGHEIVLGTMIAPGERDSPLASAGAALGLPVVTLEMPNGLSPKRLRAVRALVEEQAADIVHSHGYKANIFAALLGTRPQRAATVATLHGWTSNGGFNKLALYEHVERFLLPRIDRVVAVSPLIATRLRRLERSGRVQLIWNALPDLGPAPLDAALLDFCGQGSTVVAIGRLSPEKGFCLLLEAFRTVRVRETNARLVIIGDGPERATLERMVDEMHLREVVALPGYRENAAAYLDKASVFALSSLTEGLPLVLLEAMSRGVAVVATRVGAVPEVLREGECGTLVPAGDVPALADAIGAAMQASPARSEMIRAARSAVAERHSPARMVDGYEACYAAARARASNELPAAIVR